MISGTAGSVAGFPKPWAESWVPEIMSLISSGARSAMRLLTAVAVFFGVLSQMRAMSSEVCWSISTFVAFMTRSGFIFSYKAGLMGALPCLEAMIMRVWR